MSEENTMNETLLLTALRADLGVTSQAFSDRLLDKIHTAEARIAEEGITLENTPEDRDLVVMYAAWLWRSRVSGEGMPRMLRYALNNRLFSRKARGEG